MAETAREFFESLPARGDSTDLSGLEASYLFDLGDTGRWLVKITNGAVTVTEGAGEADCTILTSEETLLRIADGKQSPTAAYMTGKIKLKGDIAVALKLQQLF